MHVCQFNVAPPYLPCSLLPEGIQKSVGMEKFRQVQSTFLQQCTCTALLFPRSKSKGLSYQRAGVECGVIRSFPEVVIQLLMLQCCQDRYSVIYIVLCYVTACTHFIVEQTQLDPIKLSC